jgi:hypothetical protein
MMEFIEKERRPGAATPGLPKVSAFKPEPQQKYLLFTLSSG